MKNRHKVIFIVLLVIAFSSVSIYSANQEEKIQRQKTAQELQEKQDQGRTEKETVKVENIAARKAAADKAKAESAAKSAAEAEAEKEEPEPSEEAAEPEMKEVTETAEILRQPDNLYTEGIAAYIQSVNGNLSSAAAGEMAGYFVTCGNQYGLDPEIIVAVAQGESTFYPQAVSSEEYKGLMQTSDGLAMAAGYSPEALMNPEVSIQVGTGYLKELFDTFGDARLALSAYAYGAGAVNSGNYSSSYADRVLGRIAEIETFLANNGYL